MPCCVSPLRISFQKCISRIEVKMPSESILKLVCQKHVINTGGVDYPFFLGAADSKQLINVAIAPSFKPNTDNYEIAREVLDPPTKHWQRPLIQENVIAIRDRFDTDGEIMPNPILLAVNPDLESQVTIVEQKMGNGVPTGLWEISIKTQSDVDNRPLWIIDGQHRVQGLSLTARNNPPLPFVLLYSSEQVYLPSTLARIFAQVTTMAKPLNPIHHAWMQYVFNLGKYESNSIDWKSMTSVALLCSTQSYGSKPNLFYNKIQFNPEVEVTSIAPGGFDFDAKYLQELIRDRYFKNEGHDNILSERDLSEQISLAIHALKDTVRGDTESTAFFGSQNYQQKYFRDGFISGVCAYLLANGIPQNWINVLQELEFHNTDWDVSTWVNSTGGRAGSISKKLAFDCFEKVFSDGVLPEDVANICEYLKGKGSYLQVDYKLADSDGELITRRNSTQSKNFLLAEGVEKSTLQLPSDTRWIRITSPCTNVGPLEISRLGHKFVEEYQFASFKRGKTFLDEELRSLKNSLTLEIKADLYGDNSSRKQMTIKFDE